MGGEMVLRMKKEGGGSQKKLKNQKKDCGGIWGCLGGFRDIFCVGKYGNKKII
jgi:hypothetical protein